MEHAEGTTVHSLAAAARLFRNPPSIDTIRIMCKDGRLQATQGTDSRWTIFVPSDPDRVVQRRTRGPRSAVTYPAVENENDVKIADLEARLNIVILERARYRDEVLFLRGEVTGMRLERQALIAQLTAPAPVPTSWWRRLLARLRPAAALPDPTPSQLMLE